MRVLILGRTKMGGGARCIGGLAADGTAVRLLQAVNRNWSQDAPFQIGELWDLSYTASPEINPPHVEDVIVSTKARVRRVKDLRQHLLSRVTPWRGGTHDIFDGNLRFTGSNNGYICRSAGVPTCSTGFWIADRPLTLRDDGRHYDYPARFARRGLAYVGEAEAKPRIETGTLLRVSLARWWRPPDVDEIEERCYLQLSGWF